MPKKWFTTQDIVRAYAESKLQPLVDKWFTCNDDGACGCPLTALAVWQEPTLLSELEVIYQRLPDVHEDPEEVDEEIEDDLASYVRAEVISHELTDDQDFLNGVVYGWDNTAKGLSRDHDCPDLEENPPRQRSERAGYWVGAEAAVLILKL